MRQKLVLIMLMGMLAVFPACAGRADTTTENANTVEENTSSENTNTVEENTSSENTNNSSLTKYEAHTDILKIQSEEVVYSDMNKIPVYYTYTSSQLESDSSDFDRYCPNNLYDNDLATAYVEGVQGDGIGQMIDVVFDGQQSYKVDKIKIYPGYQKSDTTFINNSRPVKLSFCFPDGHYFVQELDYGDAVKGYFDIDLTDIFDEPVIAHSCIITIEDAISGKKYDDCCISEIEFYSPATVADDVILVQYEGLYQDGGEKCLVKAFNNKGTIWEYECKTELLTELSGVNYIATANNIVFVMDNWHLVALDIATGEVLWTSNPDKQFSLSAFFYDIATGNTYMSGYYGPHILAFDKDGNEIEYNADNEDCYWPIMMVPVIDDISQWGDGNGIDSIKIYYDGSMSFETYKCK